MIKKTINISLILSLLFTLSNSVTAKSTIDSIISLSENMVAYDWEVISGVESILQYDNENAMTKNSLKNLNAGNELYSAGVKLMSQKKYDQATEQFSEALKKYKRAKISANAYNYIYINMALSYANTGKEKDKAEKNGIDYIDLPVAYDGLSVVVNPKNEFLDYLTVTELRKIWQPGSTVKNWNDVRPDWPNKPIKLYGPGADSGTFDYFTKKINGKSQASRSDYTASEDDNVLVMGVAGDTYSLGYFGYAYYVENSENMKVLSVDGGSGCIHPSESTINDGTYSPLARPMYIYVNNEDLLRQEVYEFIKYYLENGTMLAIEGGYVGLPLENYDESLSRISKYQQ